MPSANVAEAWSAFWAEQGPASRCLAHAPPELLGPLDDHWRGLATALAPMGTVLDLGCGAGAVGRLLIEAEPRLEVTGIDLAEVPHSNNPHLNLLSGIAIEALPFPDRTFGAAVSQFGYEYGRTEEAAEEVARVLVPRAHLSFLIHHPDSPLVAGMRLHRLAIQALCGGQVREAFVAGDADALNQCLEALKRQYPDPIIDQAAHGLLIKIRQAPAQRQAIWNAVEEALAPERIMLEALDDFRVGHHDVGYWLDPLSKDFEIQPPAVVRVRRGEPISWLIQGQRRS